jgi:hypothetical protein
MPFAPLIRGNPEHLCTVLVIERLQTAGVICIRTTSAVHGEIQWQEG